ncbi:cytochrome P450 [Nocardia suismassiliense]|uniref:cytochrome P450 n=1 Tax=Nocardia suismassiliense TaxID=2077092 RepID=UPI001F17825F|nr:cytochrome P450 [Nocardia suismassiliense]
MTFPQDTQPRPSANRSLGDTQDSRVKLYSAEFAADPHAAYREMRQRYGSLVPVEIYPGVPATLVIGYHTAIEILQDNNNRFSADPRRWQTSVRSDCPILPMVEWRPNALRSDGVEHHRYRKATNDALEGVDQHDLHDMVERAAASLVAAFPTTGSEPERTADLITTYIQPLVFMVLNEILGCPPEIGAAIAAASAALFDSTDTETVNAMFDDAFLRLVKLKRAEPGDDVATRLVQHAAGLSDHELIHQFVTCFSAGMEPGQNLITNTLVLILTDSRFDGSGSGFIPTSTAVDEILAMDPPLANYCITYPLQPIQVAGVWLPADQPVITSMAACSNDPQINTGDYSRNGWNLGWGAGPHQCPQHARSAAYRIAVDAIDQLLDAVPELRLAVPAQDLQWRPGGFHRSLVALPVVFPAAAPPIST